jgi:hypothetical protein
LRFFLLKTFLLGVLGLLLTSCAPKITTLNSTPYFITLKTKNIKFADSGFVKQTEGGGYYIELFSAGNALFWLLLEDSSVCSEEGCMSQRGFIDRELSANYPESLLKNIISRKPIFDSKNFTKTQTGFKQSLSKVGKYEINYEVTKDSVYFSDKLNKNIIRFKELH